MRQTTVRIYEGPCTPNIFMLTSLQISSSSSSQCLLTCDCEPSFWMGTPMSSGHSRLSSQLLVDGCLSLLWESVVVLEVSTKLLLNFKLTNFPLTLAFQNSITVTMSPLTSKSHKKHAKPFLSSRRHVKEKSKAKPLVFNTFNATSFYKRMPLVLQSSE